MKTFTINIFLTFKSHKNIDFSFVFYANDTANVCI